MLTRSRILIAGCSIVLLLGICAVVYIQLQSRLICRVVLSGLAELYGGHISLESAQQSSGRVILRGLTIHSTSDPDSGIVCTVKQVDILGDAGTWVSNLASPARIVLYRPSLSISEKDWWARLPFRTDEDAQRGPLVPIHVEDGRLELVTTSSAGAQSHRRLQGIWLEIVEVETAGQPSFRVSGQIDDPLWSTWHLDGNYVQSYGQFRGRAKCKSLVLRPAQADWLKPSWRDVWKSLQPAGAISVDAEIQLQTSAKPAWQFRILLDPHDVDLKIPALPVPLKDLTGRIEISPSQTRVHALYGQIGSGSLLLSGNITAGAVPFFDLTGQIQHFSPAQVSVQLSQNHPLSRAVVSGELKLAGRLDPQSWYGAFHGSLTGLAESIPIHAIIEQGVLELESLAWKWGGGRCMADARIPLGRDGVATGSVQLQNVDLNAVSGILKDLEVVLWGSTSGLFRFSVPVNSWSEVDQWKWTGPVSLRDARFGRLSFDSLDGMLSCQDRRLTFSDGKAQLGQRTFRGQLQLTLTRPYRIECGFRTDPVQLALAGDNPSESSHKITGLLATTGTLQGVLAPRNLSLEGEGSLDGVTLNGLDLGDSSFHYSMSGHGLDLQGIEFTFLGGKVLLGGRWSWGPEAIAAAAEWPELSEPVRGHSAATIRKLELDGRFHNIKLAGLRRSWLPGSFKIYGSANGRFEVRSILGIAGQAPRTSIDGFLEAPQLRLGSYNLGRVSGAFQCTAGQIVVKQWSAESQTGRLNGSLWLRPAANGRKLTAQFSSRAIQLASLITSLGGQ